MSIRTSRKNRVGPTFRRVDDGRVSSTKKKRGKCDFLILPAPDFPPAPHRHTLPKSTTHIPMKTDITPIITTPITTGPYGS